MLSAAALLTDCSVAIWAGPTFQAGLVAVVITVIVTEKVIPGSTELIAPEAEVVFIAGHPNLVLELSHRAVVFQNLPLMVWVDHAGLNGFLYDLSIYAASGRIIIEVQSLHNQCV